MNMKILLGKDIHPIAAVMATRLASLGHEVILDELQMYLDADRYCRPPGHRVGTNDVRHDG